MRVARLRFSVTPKVPFKAQPKLPNRWSDMSDRASAATSSPPTASAATPTPTASAVQRPAIPVEGVVLFPENVDQVGGGRTEIPRRCPRMPPDAFERKYILSWQLVGRHASEATQRRTLSGLRSCVRSVRDRVCTCAFAFALCLRLRLHACVCVCTLSATAFACEMVQS